MKSNDPTFQATIADVQKSLLECVCTHGVHDRSIRNSAYTLNQNNLC